MPISPDSSFQNTLNVFRISCQAQNYAWGKLGSSSAVAKLAPNACANLQPVNEQLPYAELWMGTHPNAPSSVFENPQISLLDTLRTRPGIMTQAVEEKFKTDLPFLFKVLSVNKALSIQAHPDLKLAETLHQRSPNMYKDPNHKPEMAIALTPFEGLCGFRGLEEIAIHFDMFPEFASLVGADLVNEFLGYVREFNVKRRTSLPSSIRDENDYNDKRVLRHVFEALMKSEASVVASHLKRLVARLVADEKTYQQGSVQELVLRLNQQYPDDVGCFCALLLNYVLLQPGQAMFLAANEPHAYLSGDCVECMATSDNVVRAGLTPKAKDVDVLVEMLTYESFTADQVLMKGEFFPSTERQKHSIVYRAPVPEFSVIHSKFVPLQKAAFQGISGPSIILFTDGTGILEADNQHNPFAAGYVYFVAANTPIVIESQTETQAFRAFCDLNVIPHVDSS